MWVERDEFLRSGTSRLVDAEVVLDIGCGIRPQTFIKPLVHICCEPYGEYVDVLQQSVTERTDCLFVVLQHDWRAVVELFGPESVDTVFILDVIEHLEKQSGRALLALTEQIARKQIVVFTPLGFVEQHTTQDGRDAWGLHGAAWQAHRSGWMPQDFDDSWSVIACRDFHRHNNIGEELETPFGALWAIKTRDAESPAPSIEYRASLGPKLLEAAKRTIQALRTDQDKLKLLTEDLKRLNEALSGEMQERRSLEQEITTLKATLENARQARAAISQEVHVLLRRYRVFEALRKRLSILLKWE